MANLIRSVKAGSDWTETELCAYNIEVVSENVATFFGNADLPPPTTSIRPVILAYETYPAAGLPTDEWDDHALFRCLEKAMNITPGENSTVVAFAHLLLILLKYNSSEHCLQLRMDIPLYICSANTLTHTDICLVEYPTQRNVLLFQEDKRHLEGNDPEPQLIAEAIAAFQYHNHRLSALGLPTVNAAVIPGITMVRTAPTFYKIDVNTALVEAVELGEYPLQTTIVHKLIPPVQVLKDFQQDGMKPLENRAVILSCFEAFKQFL
jgi:hypothetical protein